MKSCGAARLEYSTGVESVGVRADACWDNVRWNTNSESEIATCSGPRGTLPKRKFAAGVGKGYVGVKRDGKFSLRVFRRTIRHILGERVNGVRVLSGIEGRECAGDNLRVRKFEPPNVHTWGASARAVPLERNPRRRTNREFVYHRGTPSHRLTRLSTTPISTYDYLAMRQRTQHPVVPIHTTVEFKLFNTLMKTGVFYKQPTSKQPLASQISQSVDFEKLAKHWATLVHFGQS
ncbi:hypothetical protein C8R46DRAFT_1040614 [Mycena filopes]|nr:hypothetical protein C8R46DRAFT_1040614 [Mycena filopes]